MKSHFGRILTSLFDTAEVMQSGFYSTGWLKIAYVYDQNMARNEVRQQPSIFTVHF
ncbi:hypothetical protein MASR2M79_13300 [Aminivibrio sp.]